MGLSTFSTFYYGIKIDTNSQNLNFSEGGGELTAVISVGSYALSDFVVKIQDALNTAGALVYIVTVDRNTRQITISATGTFEILLLSGTQISTSPFSIMGFSGGSDLTGSATYTGASGSGSEYTPQALLQDYVDGEHQIEKIQSSVNESGSGDLEIISFGEKKIIEMSFKWINNNIEVRGFVKKDSNAVSNVLVFLNDLIRRGPLEFMPDISTRSTFKKCVLESTPSSSKGIGFKLEEHSELQDFHNIGPVKFRIKE